MASRRGITLNKALARIDPLTIRRIAEGRYKPKATSLHDGGGLYIRPPENGGGSWYFRFQSGGRVHLMGLGSVAQVGAQLRKGDEQALALLGRELGLEQHLDHRGIAGLVAAIAVERTEELRESSAQHGVCTL